MINGIQCPDCKDFITVEYFHPTHKAVEKVNEVVKILDNDEDKDRDQQFICTRCDLLLVPLSLRNRSFDKAVNTFDVVERKTMRTRERRVS